MYTIFNILIDSNLSALIIRLKLAIDQNDDNLENKRLGHLVFK